MPQDIDQIQDFFKEYTSDAANLRTEIEALNEILAENGKKKFDFRLLETMRERSIQGTQDKELAGYLVKLMNDDDNAYHYHLASIIRSAIGSVLEIEKYLKDHNQAHAVKMAMIDAERKKDTRHQWKQFAHRTARWALGAVATVLIYSTFVHLSGDGTGFIKVPGVSTIEKFVPNP